jgi:capsular polysaccharide export protein
MFLSWRHPARIEAQVDRRSRLALVTPGLRRIATLAGLLPEWQLVSGQGARALPPEAVLAWGQKPSARAAQRFAHDRGLPLWRAEDGFLRSVGLGDQCPPLSIVLDDEGIYYDAAAPSRLERLIAAGCGPAEQDRAERLRARWVQARVSKYNHTRGGLPAGLRRQLAQAPVLVVDQTASDVSIPASGASAADFERMLQAALDEHPGAPIWLKVHPDVVAGRKRGHFDGVAAASDARVTLIAGDVHPPDLLEACRAVYVVSSQMGFEALLWSRPVRCFGMPFFAGWGLTQDELARPARRRGACPALAELTHAALIAYPRCLDPETGRRCEPERLIEHIELQRRMRERCPPQLQLLGFSRWKRPIAQAFLQGSMVGFARTARSVDAGRALGVWGRKPAPAAAHGTVLRIEDGFIRSVGLGADLTRPLSWVIDDIGIYFDATVPSRLEQLLQQHRFDAPLLARARALREAVVAAGITKYNVGAGCWQRPSLDRAVILVPGQVESDASIAWGAPGIATNLGLLRAVRAAEPHAYLVHKPHPDVLAGLRGGPAQTRRLLAECAALCDEVVTDVNMGQLLGQVDAVHTLTSLTGFEALMRGKRVTAWGLPFYAGWGLTEDRAPPGSPALLRRQRRLDLDQLVAAVLVLYPAYVSRVSGAFTTPERALLELGELQRSGAAAAVQGSAWRALKRRAVRVLARLRGL